MPQSNNKFRSNHTFRSHVLGRTAFETEQKRKTERKGEHVVCLKIILWLEAPGEEAE